MKIILSSAIVVALLISMPIAVMGQEEAHIEHPDTIKRLERIKLELPEISNWAPVEVKVYFVRDEPTPPFEQNIQFYDEKQTSSGNRPSILTIWNKANDKQRMAPSPVFEISDGVESLGPARLVLSAGWGWRGSFEHGVYHTFCSYHLNVPTLTDEEELTIAFAEKAGGLKPAISVGAVSLEQFLTEHDGAISFSRLLLKKSEEPIRRPVLTDYCAHWGAPLQGMMGLSSLPSFVGFPNSSGRFDLWLALDYHEDKENMVKDCRATITLCDSDARIARDGTLKSAMPLDIVPVRLLTSPDQKDKYLGVYAQYHIDGCFRTTHSRASGNSPTELYLQSGFAYNLYVFENIKDYGLLRHVEIPIDRPEEIVLDLGNRSFKGFDSKRLDFNEIMPVEILWEYTLEGWPKFVFDLHKFWYRLWN